MSVVTNQYGEVSVLTLKEDFVGEVVDSFKHRASQATDQHHYSIVVDLTSVAGIDSAALEALLELQNQVEEMLGAVKLCGLDDTCRKVLQITRLARRFEVFDDLESAVKSFS